MTKIDACGRSCPEPVIMTKKALVTKEMQYEILVDNTTALGNVTRFAENNGYVVSVTDDGEVFTLRLKKK